MNSAIIKTPLVGIETCKSVLAVGEDTVLDLIECGKLRWAWNLAAPGTHTRLLRVLANSLVDLANSSSTQPGDLSGAIRYQ